MIVKSGSGVMKSLITEYGPEWIINRSLYSAKLKIMSLVPASEKLFERKANIKRIDIFEFDISSIKSFLLQLPEEKKTDIIELADKAIKGVIRGFSSVELNYGDPINWFYNPITGKEYDKCVKWYRIPDFDKVRGDIKVVWEVSRFTHFFLLVRAYLLTGDKKYYEAFSNQLENWLKENNYSYGPNFKCGQECTLRMINAIMAFTVFNSEGLATDNDKRNVIKLTEICYKKVRSNFFYAHKCIKNNHTLTELCGLIIGAWCCGYDDKVRKAYKLFDMEIRKQFIPDGGYRQYSFNYQRLALQMVECLLKISKKTGYYLTETDRIKNSVLLMYQAQVENGDLPNYGHNDGALFFPVTCCDYRDFRPPLNALYMLLTGKRLYEHGLCDEENLWFGEPDEKSFEYMEKRPAAYKDSGIFTLRHDGGFLMTILQNFNSRPAHMDQFHIDLWHKGVNVLCDSGTYSYASELGEKLSLTSAHNTVKLHDTDQMNKRGAFLIYDWTKCKNVLYDTDRFSAIMVSANGYEHKREILRTGSGYNIYDEVKGNGDYCEFLFHTPCEAVLIPGGFELIDGNRRLCKITSDVFDITINKEYRSLYYMKKEEINCISVKCSLEGKRCSARFNIELAG